MTPLRFLLVCFAGWMNHRHQLVIEYLEEESHDRSTLFTEQFREILKSDGVEPLRLPVRSPNLNAFAERFVRSMRESCVERMIFFGEPALRRAVSQFALHYHTERNHQGLENKIIQPEFAEFPDSGTIRSRQRLGGLLRYYYREAA